MDHPAGGQVGVGWQTRPEVDQAEAVITWHGDLIRSYAVQAASEKVTRLANETITMLREKREKVVKEDGSIAARPASRSGGAHLVPSIARAAPPATGDTKALTRYTTALYPVPYLLPVRWSVAKASPPGGCFFGHT